MYKQAQEFNLLHFITCVIPSNNQAVGVPQAYPTNSSNYCTHDAYHYFGLCAWFHHQTSAKAFEG